eukprot:365977-Chlamydomonas_euryale.AAC.8
MSVYPHVQPRRGDPCTKHSSRSQVEACHACRGRGRPSAWDMHVLVLGPASASAGVIGRDRRPRRACFVQG